MNSFRSKLRGITSASLGYAGDKESSFIKFIPRRKQRAIQI